MPDPYWVYKEYTYYAFMIYGVELYEPDSIQTQSVSSLELTIFNERGFKTMESDKRDPDFFVMFERI